MKSFGQSTINQLAINSTQKRKKPQSQSRNQTVKRSLKSRAKKFNPIKRLVFAKDIFDEKYFNKALATALKRNWILNPFHPP